MTKRFVTELQDKLALLEKQIQLHDLRGTSLAQKRNSLKEELQEICGHENQEQESDYHSGSYDEVARTYYRIVCQDCNKTLKSWNKGHGYYG